MRAPPRCAAALPADRFRPLVPEPPLRLRGAPAPVHRAPAWARAARFEAVGQTPFVASNDPRLTHRSTGALPSAAT